MSLRNLDALFEPKTIALIGASNTPRSIGAVLARNLFEGGFDGLVLAVNPTERAIRSTRNYRSIAELPEAPDLAVIATPAGCVPGIIGELGGRGCRAAVVITAGFDAALRRDMLAAARPHLLRVLGPNCLGLASPHRGINATFAHVAPQPGGIAFVSQSGAVATAVLDWARARGIGFSHVVTVGDMSDVDFGDLLDWLALDRRTHAIVLYVESVTQARKFMSAARVAARAKPVVAVKAGRSTAGAAAAQSHTGALAGSDAVYDAAFSRAGMLRVNELGELFEAVAVLATGIRLRGSELTILTNGGGMGVLAADQAEQRGIRLAPLDPARRARLDTVLPPSWPRSNPVDILGDATGVRYTQALQALIGSASNTFPDTLLVLNCPTAVGDSLESAQALVDVVKENPRLPVLTAWLGEGAAAEARRLFARHRIPSFETPEDAVRAHAHLVAYRRNQELLMETPAADETGFEPDRAAARQLIDGALAEGRTALDEAQTKTLLGAYGIATVDTRTAVDADGAAAAARAIGCPVVLKILSPDIAHKSDVGGVALDLATPEEVVERARAMLETVRAAQPQARIDGFTVQTMVQRSRAVELIAGLADDAVFGPVVLFGRGGTAAEVIGDRSIGLPPLNPVLARAMIARTRVARRLAGYRDQPAADIDAIVRTLVRLAELAADCPELAELDINPLLAGADGAVALDAAAVLRRPAGARRFAIEPWPRQLARDIETQGGARYHLRPIRPEDEAALVDMLRHCARDDIRMRFFVSVKTFDHAFAARLTQIDYDREMAFVAVAPRDAAQPEVICGVARLAADPDFDAAEYAVMVRSDLKGTGLGYLLMQEILAHARAKGLKRVFGEVLHDNHAMLAMTREFGFSHRRAPDEPGVVMVSLDLA